MLFHTWPFALFLAVTAAGVAIARGATGRKIVLLAASYAFYAWWSVPMLLPLFATTFIDYFLAQWIEAETRERRRLDLLVLSLTANLGLLAFFKYYDFFAASLGSWFDFTPALAGVVLPIGISFYTFHTMSYTIDVYRREIPASRSALDFALFIAFFPVLVAGPILRARQFLPQLAHPAPARFSMPVALLFIRGLAKKVLVADNVAPLVDTVFARPGEWPSLVVWTATLAFAVQIYCDFSGYSDMARALAAAFGFEIPLNFDRPYTAGNPRDFWRRWHMSLSTWLRDYLFIPLGGSRHRLARNLMITMLLGGLWHGASWNFVLWGALHGVLLVLWRARWSPQWSGGPGTPEALPRPLTRAASQLVFWYVLLLTWIPFRVRDSRDMLVALRKFVLFDFDFALAHRGLTSVYFLTTALLLAAFLAVHFWSARNGDLDARIARLPLPAQLAAGLAMGAAFYLFWPGGSAPFIYFQF